MPKLTLQTNFDVATLLLGDFSAASVTATSTSVTYTLGTRVLKLHGAFALAGGQPSSGAVSGLVYAVGGVSQFSISAADWTFAAFQDALANDDFGALLSASDLVLGSSAGNVLRGYAGDDVLRAGGGNDTIYGSYGNDTLDGGAGADRMQGGSGDDVYRVDLAGDATLEFAGGGVDRVETTRAAHTLAAHVENLSYLGNADFTATGNSEANLIVGGKGADSIAGRGGDDTLRGGNGNDSLDGGDGHDWLIGDAGAAAVTTTAGRASPSQPGLPISLSMTMAEVASTTTTTVSGYINNATLGSGSFNLAFVLDISGSMASSFSGANVGDTNFDGVANTKLDAAIASFEALVASINASGLGSSVRIGLIPFESASDIRAIGSGTSDTDGNGVADVIDAARSLDDAGGTAYELGLQNAVDFFHASPDGDNFVFFLSDGAPNHTDYEGYLQQLRSEAGIHASIRALGIEAGTGGYYDVLDALDDGKLNDTAINVTDPSSLTAGLLDSQVNAADIKHLEIYKNGTLLTTLTPAQLTQTPFGLKYSYTITGLNSAGTDQIETRLVLQDAQSSFISTAQTITVGTLASNDSLSGGAGDDTLDGGAGVDTLVGGAGDDTYRVDSTGDWISEASAGGWDRVESTVSYSLNRSITAHVEGLSLLGSGNTHGTGNGRANRVEGNIGNNTIDGLGGSDTLAGGFGIDTVSYASAAAAATVNLETGVARVGADTDTLSGFENIRGSRYGDQLTGDRGDNSFVGLGGNDSIQGGSGFDSVDYAAATSGVTVALNTSYAGGTASSANGAEGTDTLVQVERIVGSRYADRISDGQYTAGLANRFEGGAGNDTLLGGHGSDTLVGGSGNDSMHGGASQYGSEIDLVDYSGATSAISGGLAGTITGSSTGTDTLADIEWIVATAYADNISGSAAAERFEGAAGNDTLSGGGGNDTLDGGAGGDRLVGGAGDDLFVVDSGFDRIVETASGGIDSVESSVAFTLAAGVENLVLTGSAALRGNGNAAANTITGNDGNNLLSGLGGNDTILAGLGNDVVLGGEGADSLTGGEGTDLLSYAGSASAVSGTLNGSGVGYFGTTSGTDSVSSFENLLGSSYADQLTGDSYANRIDGAAGNDTLGGGWGDDTLVGGAGNDLLDGGGGVDEISYAYYTASGINADLSAGLIVGHGTDTISGTSIERITGTRLNDTIAWNSSSTSTYTDFVLSGGGGADYLQGSAGDDLLDGGTGQDTMEGGSGYDTYVVDSASDVVLEAAYAGTDTVLSSISYRLSDHLEHLTLVGSVATTGTGNGLSNVLTGNRLNNTLSAGQGSDTLVGGLGRDTLDGGLDSATDVFRFEDLADSKVSARDRIVNFNPAHDVIDLRGIDAIASSTSSSNESFLFIGTSSFSGMAGQLRYGRAGGDTFVYGDVDGDKAADFAIQIAGEHLLSSSDFWL